MNGTAAATLGRPRTRAMATRTMAVSTRIAGSMECETALAIGTSAGRCRSKKPWSAATSSQRTDAENATASQIRAAAPAQPAAAISSQIGRRDTTEGYPDDCQRHLRGSNPDMEDRRTLSRRSQRLKHNGSRWLLGGVIAALIGVLL